MKKMYNKLRRCNSWMAVVVCEDECWKRRV